MSVASVGLGGCLSDQLIEQSSVTGVSVWPLTGLRVRTRSVLAHQARPISQLLVVFPPSHIPWRQDQGVSNSSARPVTKLTTYYFS